MLKTEYEIIRVYYLERQRQKEVYTIQIYPNF